LRLLFECRVQLRAHASVRRSIEVPLRLLSAPSTGTEAALLAAHEPSVAAAAAARQQ
jgi:hypothetical protein